MDLKELIEKIMAEKNLNVEELSKEIGISASVLRNVLKSKGEISKYGREKLDKYCADNGISKEPDENTADEEELLDEPEADGVNEDDKEYLQEVAEKLRAYITNELELEADVNLEDGTAMVGTAIGFNEFDCEAYATMLCSANSSLILYLQFDELEPSLDAFKLINDFNMNQPVFKALINEENRLELQYTALETADAEQVVNLVDFALTRLFEEQYEELLKPITDLL